MTVHVGEGKVTVVAGAEPGAPGPGLYQLLGVPRTASQDEIARAWRRRALAEHPDSRPGDAAAAGRFRALAGAWHVLGDPARRAAYDQVLAREQALRSAPRLPEPAIVAPSARRPGPPPLWAGPVRVESPRRAPARLEEEIGLALLALRYLARDPAWPW